MNTQENRPIYIAHFVMIPMTGVGIFGGFRSQEWFKNRLEIFKKYTLKSLLQQTNLNFTIWLTFRPQEFNNHLVKELEEYLKDKGVKTIMTFDGLMYNDDKFSGKFKDRFMNMARVVRQAWREKDLSYLWGIQEVYQNKNNTLVQRLTNSLKALESLGNFKPVEYVYLTRIDSDDMFHKDTVKNIQAIAPFNGAIACKKGYIYNSETHQMAEWTPPTNPPFHTIIFPREVFFDAAYHKQHYRTFTSHEDIPKVFFCKPLPDYSYCVLVHPTEGSHISTIFHHPFRGKIITENVEEILKNYV